MKTFTLMLLISALAFQLTFAQSPFSPLQDKVPTVTIQLNGYDVATDTALEVKFVLVQPASDHQKTTTLAPDAEGKVSYTLPEPFRYQQIWFSVGEYYYGQLTVDQGLDIDIQLSALKLASDKYASPSVHFAGPDGAMNKFMNDYIVFRNKYRDTGEFPDPREVMMDRVITPAEKVSKLRPIYQAQAAMEQQFLKENPSPYGWILENERLSDFYGSVCVAHWGKEMAPELMKEVLEHEPKLISNDGASNYYGYLQTFLFIPSPKEHIRIYEEELLPNIIPEDQERLRHHVDQWRKKLAEESYDEDTWKTDSRYFYQQYGDEFFSGQIKNFLRKTADLPAAKADRIKIQGGDREIPKHEEYLRLVLPTLQTEQYHEMMESRWAKAKKQVEAINEKLANIQIDRADTPVGKSLGTLPNGATLYEAETDDLTTFLASLRSTSSGKAMILDIWATWCAPCVYDMKEGAEKRAQLAEMGVEVVYLCTTSGTNLEGWKKMVTQLDVNTRHVYMTEEVSKKIMKEFNLTGYPSHIFIDSKGKYHPGMVHALRMVDLEYIREKM